MACPECFSFPLKVLVLHQATFLSAGSVVLYLLYILAGFSAAHLGFCCDTHL